MEFLFKLWIQRGLPSHYYAYMSGLQTVDAGWPVSVKIMQPILS